MFYKVECKCTKNKCVNIVEAINGAEALVNFSNEVCDEDHISRYAYSVPEIEGWTLVKCEKNRNCI